LLSDEVHKTPDIQTRMSLIYDAGVRRKHHGA
jgi:hypothetical protein